MNAFWHMGHFLGSKSLATTLPGGGAGGNGAFVVSVEEDDAEEDLVFAVVAPLFFLVGSRPPSGALRFIVSYTMGCQFLMGP